MKNETTAIHIFESEWIQATSGKFSHMVRIESNYTQQGIPDLNICFVGIDFWIEFKFNDVPRPLQTSWIKRRQIAGGIAYIKEFDSTVDIRAQAKRHVNHILNDLESRGFKV